MKRLVLLIPAVMTMAASCRPGTPGPIPSPTPPPKIGYDCSQKPALSGLVPVARAIAGKYIVVLKNRTPADRTRMQPLMQAQDVTEVKTLQQGYSARLAVLAVARILADPNVEYVQQDGQVTVNPLAGFQAATWGQDRVDQLQLPLDGLYSPGGDGIDVNVAVVDTGITKVADFDERLQPGGFSAHGGTEDGHGHGTHVSGTIAGNRWGIAKQALLWAVRVLDSSGSGSDSDVIRGIEWVVGKKIALGGDWVINMSLGGGASPALDQAVCDAISAGVVVAVAAGNEGEDARNSSPARVRQAITVGASDNTDHQATFSNFGPLLDLFAPGVDITSDQPGGGTATWSGTSMATPHVAGAAALYLERHPGAPQQQVADWLVEAGSVSQAMRDLPAGQGSPNALLFVKE